MTDNSNRINQLLEKLDTLSKRQEAFSREIDSLRAELNRLKFAETTQAGDNENVLGANAAPAPRQEQPKPAIPRPAMPSMPQLPKAKSDLEKFIGENLINKIGIAITVIGVAIGAKYAIDHELISPLTRIVLGYLFGAALLLFAIKLKRKYENFSAVLLSGAIAILYFITYAAYSFYALIPQGVAFAVMVAFTAFTVLAALQYNKQVIALIGLVGAYGVPFLLSDGSGNVAVLFTYMTVINAGIGMIAFRKYWKPLYYSSFGLTWLIYISWYIGGYHEATHFRLALLFLSLFFVIFYLAFLSYKLFRNEQFDLPDVVLLLVNSFIFYGFGYAVLNSNQMGSRLSGLFTLLNAGVHFVVSVVIYRKRLADKNLFYLISGLVLVFITIAIPVQLDGNWVTLLWAGEVALLFWIGRTKAISVYEKLSYPLMILAFCSISHDWLMAYNNYYPDSPQTRLTPIVNIHFLSSLLFIAAFGFITRLGQNKNYASAFAQQNIMSKAAAFLAPAIFTFTIYYAFYIEIENYWSQLYTDSSITIKTGNSQSVGFQANHDLENFGSIWIINYSLLFVSLLAFVNFRWLQNRQLGLINLGLLLLSLLVFLTQGLYALSELRESYLSQTLSQYYTRGPFNIGIRYVSFVFATLAVVACYKYARRDFMETDFKIPVDFLVHTVVLWVASSELINWMDMAASTQSYKLGLSILWGIYSLLLISLGIWKRRRYLRIGAIVLFGVTLIKLFFYDISHLGTIAKTIVLVSLGVLLLVISFLYNKYRHTIFNEVDK